MRAIQVRSEVPLEARTNTNGWNALYRPMDGGGYGIWEPWIGYGYVPPAGPATVSICFMATIIHLKTAANRKMGIRISAIQGATWHTFTLLETTSHTLYTGHRYLCEASLRIVFPHLGTPHGYARMALVREDGSGTPLVYAKAAPMPPPFSPASSFKGRIEVYRTDRYDYDFAGHAHLETSNVSFP